MKSKLLCWPAGVASVYLLKLICILLFVHYTLAVVEGQSCLFANLAGFFLLQSLWLDCFPCLESLFLTLYIADTSVVFGSQHKIILSRRLALTNLPKVSLYICPSSPLHYIFYFISLAVLTII